MKRIISSILCIITLFSLLSLSVSSADTKKGITIERMSTSGVEHPVGYYNTDKRYETLPLTWEAWVYIPKKIYSQRCGPILGNYQSFSKDEYVNFEIHKNGIPRLVFGISDGTMYDFMFDQAAVPADKWTHVAIVYGTGTQNQQIYCYINGELKQKTAVSKWFEAPATTIDNMVCLGGDYRALNEVAFRGELGDVWVYSDVRDARNVLADYQNGPDLSDPNLMLYYELFAAESAADVPDKSGNGYDMGYYRYWLTEEEMNEIRAEDEYDYEYVIAFIPDMQYMTQNNPTGLQTMITWLVENGKSKNIQYIIGLGDITNSNAQREWSTVVRQTNKLNGYIPYALVPGNHDVLLNSRQELFNKTYAVKTGYYYKQVDTTGGFFDPESVRNTYMTFSVGEIDYIIIVLDFGATDDILAWAGEILDAHPNHRAILATHGYLNSDGTTLDSNDYASPDEYDSVLNSGEATWQKLVSKHENIDMIVSGHMSHDTIVVTPREGDAGNTVYQILMDPQSTCKKLNSLGAVGLMYFTADGNHAKVEYYSTVHGLYFAESNKNILLTFGEDEPEETTAAETEAPATDTDPTTETDVEILVEKGCGAALNASSVVFAFILLPAIIKKKRIA